MARQNASAAAADFAETTSRQAHDSFCAGNPRHHREAEAAEQLRAQQSGRDRNHKRLSSACAPAEGRCISGDCAHVVPSELNILSLMWQLSISWWELVLRVVIIYFFLLLLLRLSGKRQVGQLA